MKVFNKVTDSTLWTFVSTCLPVEHATTLALRARENIVGKNVY